MKKQIVAAAVAGVMSFGAVFGAAAAGVGYVNFGALIQGHPKMAKADLEMRAEVQKKQEKFEAELAKLNDDAAKQRLAEKYQRELMEKENALLTPIYNDVMKAIEKTRKEKDLDIIVDEAAVLAGGVDITVDAQKKL